jgi:hypothetical protein
MMDCTKRKSSYELALIGAKQAVLVFGRKARVIERRQFFKETFYFPGFLLAESMGVILQLSANHRASWRPECRNFWAFNCFWIAATWLSPGSILTSWHNVARNHHAKGSFDR